VKATVVLAIFAFTVGPAAVTYALIARPARTQQPGEET
jgi:hypothetical protein